MTSGTEEKLSVGYVSPGWPMGSIANGIIPYVEAMYENLDRMGHRVSVVSTSPVQRADVRVYDAYAVGNPPTTVVRAVNALRYRLAPRSTSLRVLRDRLLTTISRAIVEQSIQLVEIEEAFGLAAELIPRLSVPVVVRLHGPWFLNGPADGIEDSPDYRDRVEAEGRGIRMAGGITAPSQEVINRVRSFYGLELPHAEAIPVPLRSIPPGSQWRLDECDGRKVLFIGRFDRHKGADLLIDAFAKVLAQVPDARLELVGPDLGFRDDLGRVWSLEERVRDRIPGSLESGAVRWLGRVPVDALAGLRRQAFMTVVPSRYETFGLTVQESMVQGCPQVAAATGGIPEIVTDGVHALLHQPGDANDLADKILTLLRDPDRAARLGRQAAIDAQQRFHPGAVAGRIVECYRRVLHRHSVAVRGR